MFKTRKNTKFNSDDREVYDSLLVRWASVYLQISNLSKRSCIAACLKHDLKHNVKDTWEGATEIGNK